MPSTRARLHCSSRTNAVTTRKCGASPSPVNSTVSAARKKHKYPSLPKTLVNLERWIAGYSTGIAWAVGVVVVWGMAFLLLHLTLYPFPDITRELNKHELVCNDKVVSRMPTDRDPSCHLGGYPNLGG